MVMLRTAGWLAIIVAGMGLAPAGAAVPEFKAAIVQTYPHDPQAFTEGLLYQDGFLDESTGREGQSSVRKVQLDTGAVLMQHDIDKKLLWRGDRHLEKPAAGTDLEGPDRIDL